MGTIGQIIGGVLGIGGSLLGKQSKEKAQKQQFENEKSLMGLQAGYNREQAKYSQQLAKEMWNYTNYEAQVRHLKAARFCFWKKCKATGGRKERRKGFY